MRERRLTGVGAAPGVTWGLAWRLDGVPLTAERVPEAGRPMQLQLALEALAAAAAELDELGARVRERGDQDGADMVEAAALMARDNTLQAALRRAALEAGLPAPAAVRAAADELAGLLAGLEDPMLAARADDVRSVGRRAAAHLLRPAGPSTPSGGADRVLVAGDLGPADVAELERGRAGIALAGGGVTAHAAIVARSLGLPMVVGLGPALLDVPEGMPLVVDGDAGAVIVDPGPALLARARTARTRAADDRRRAAATSGLAAETADGRRVPIRANASTAAEVDLALDAGAEGVGLLRTELLFLDAAAWPDAGHHERALRPVLRRLGGALATVRLLDFGGDKTPPFLRGTPLRGIELLLEAPAALEAQLAAILRAAHGPLRLLIPMVTEPAQVRAVRAALDGLVPAGVPAPVLGAMVEVPAAVTMADRIAAEVGLLGLGTNDLAQFELGRDRSLPGRAPAHHPAVLRRVAETVARAREAGVPVEVCGEAASHPLAMPLLVGLGVDELSVGAARVGEVRGWLRRLSFAAARETARLALEAASAAEVEELAAPLLAQAGDAVGER